MWESSRYDLSSDNQIMCENEHFVSVRAKCKEDAEKFLIDSGYSIQPCHYETDSTFTTVMLDKYVYKSFSFFKNK